MKFFFNFFTFWKRKRSTQFHIFWTNWTETRFSNFAWEGSTMRDCGRRKIVMRWFIIARKSKHKFFDWGTWCCRWYGLFTSMDSLFHNNRKQVLPVLHAGRGSRLQVLLKGRNLLTSSCRTPSVKFLNDARKFRDHALHNWKWPSPLGEKNK